MGTRVNIVKCPPRADFSPEANPPRVEPRGEPLVEPPTDILHFVLSRYVQPLYVNHPSLKHKFFSNNNHKINWVVRNNCDIINM